MQLSPSNRRLIVISLWLLLAFMGYAVVVFRPSHNQTATLEVDAAPTSSQITVDGHGVSVGSVAVTPGQHTVAATAKGFAKQSQKVSLAKGETKFVGLVLASNSNTTANWYKDNPSEQYYAEGITSRNISQSSTDALAANPLLVLLPTYGVRDEYRIDYGAAPDSSKIKQPIVYIKADKPTGRQDAVAWIKAQGVNPSEIPIVFTDVNNPLGGGGE